MAHKKAPPKRKAPAKRKSTSTRAKKAAPAQAVHSHEHVHVARPVMRLAIVSITVFIAFLLGYGLGLENALSEFFNSFAY